jgi:hypothetical protein
VRKPFTRRPAVVVDSSHMTLLHQEAIEQLELMRSVVDAHEYAADAMRDTLKTMAENHWEAYLDIVHMICLHDDNMSAALRKHGLKFRSGENEETIDFTPKERQWGSKALLTYLIAGLIGRHNRFINCYRPRANPMVEYFKESLAREREHLADMVSMISYVI